VGDFTLENIGNPSYHKHRKTASSKKQEEEKDEDEESKMSISADESRVQLVQQGVEHL